MLKQLSSKKRLLTHGNCAENTLLPQVLFSTLTPYLPPEPKLATPRLCPRLPFPSEPSHAPAPEHT